VIVGSAVEVLDHRLQEAEEQVWRDGLTGDTH